MKSIEFLTKTLFERYAIRKTNKAASWHHLSEERQIAWKEDTIFIAEEILREIHKDLKLVNRIDNFNTSFDKGYAKGQNSEAIRIQNTFDEILRKIKFEDGRN